MSRIASTPQQEHTTAVWGRESAQTFHSREDSTGQEIWGNIMYSSSRRQRSQAERLASLSQRPRTFFHHDALSVSLPAHDVMALPDIPEGVSRRSFARSLQRLRLNTHQRGKFFHRPRPFAVTSYVSGLRLCDFATFHRSAARRLRSRSATNFLAPPQLHFTSLQRLRLSAGYQSKPKIFGPTRSTSGACHLEAAASTSEFARSARGANPQCDHVLAATAAAIHFTVAATARPLNERNSFHSTDVTASARDHRCGAQ